MSKEKLNIVVIGHVDSGKSTTSGHLIWKAGGIDTRILEKYEKESAQIGKASFKYAWVLDCHKAERIRGVTIESMAKQFETSNRIVTIIDAPGHKDFIKNMITGTSQADVALLVIPATMGECETACAKDGQAREHSALANCFGIKNMIVGVNKMDAVGYDENRFNEVVEGAKRFLKPLGFNEERTMFVPISGYCGDNLVEKSANMPWFKGFKDGKYTLLDAFDLAPIPERLNSRPLRIPINNVFKIAGIGSVNSGRVETGTISPGNKILIAPGNIGGEVKSVQIMHEDVPEGKSGEIVAFNARIDASNIPVSRGMVVGKAADNPPRETESFTAKVYFIKNISKVGIKAGFKPNMMVHTANACAEIVKITDSYDKKTNKLTGVIPETCKQGDVIVCTFKPIKPLIVEPVTEFPPLGRFALREQQNTFAVGVVQTTVSRDPNAKPGVPAAKGASSTAKGTAPAAKNVAKKK
uniref:Elongation factor 1 alpha n=1 Tax=Tetracapsuloides bryosalmonae TaxID=271932 RepID=A0A859IQF0_9CNID|nr:elongation factor 1 alpha [Tetracapsuloides bryosalmonae]